MRHRAIAIFTLLPAIAALGFGAPAEASANRPKASARPKTPGKSPPARTYPVDRTRPLEQPVKGSTPYDRYLGSVRHVLQNLDGRNPPSMEEVHRLMQEAYEFRY